MGSNQLKPTKYKQLMAETVANNQEGTELGMGAPRAMEKVMGDIVPVILYGRASANIITLNLLVALKY